MQEQSGPAGAEVEEKAEEADPSTSAVRSVFCPDTLAASDDGWDQHYYAVGLGCTNLGSVAA